MKIVTQGESPPPPSRRTHMTRPIPREEDKAGGVAAVLPLRVRVRPPNVERRMQGRKVTAPNDLSILLFGPASLPFPLGPSIDDVRKIYGFFYTPPP